MQPSRLPQILTAGAIVLIAAIMRRRLKQHTPVAADHTPDNVTMRRCDDCGSCSWPGAEHCAHCGADVVAARA